MIGSSSKQAYKFSFYLTARKKAAWQKCRELPQLIHHQGKQWTHHQRQSRQNHSRHLKNSITVISELTYTKSITQIWQHT